MSPPSTVSYGSWCVPNRLLLRVFTFYPLLSVRLMGRARSVGTTATTVVCVFPLRVNAPSHLPRDYSRYQASPPFATLPTALSAGTEPFRCPRFQGCGVSHDISENLKTTRFHFQCCSVSIWYQQFFPYPDQRFVLDSEDIFFLQTNASQPWTRSVLVFFFIIRTQRSTGDLTCLVVSLPYFGLVTPELAHVPS
jgi:hypothetical protein